MSFLKRGGALRKSRSFKLHCNTYITQRLQSPRPVTTTFHRAVVWHNVKFPQGHVSQKGCHICPHRLSPVPRAGSSGGGKSPRCPGSAEPSRVQQGRRLRTRWKRRDTAASPSVPPRPTERPARPASPAAPTSAGLHRPSRGRRLRESRSDSRSSHLVYSRQQPSSYRGRPRDTWPHRHLRCAANTSPAGPSASPSKRPNACFLRGRLVTRPLRLHPGLTPTSEPSPLDFHSPHTVTGSAFGQREGCRWEAVVGIQAAAVDKVRVPLGPCAGPEQSVKGVTGLEGGLGSAGYRGTLGRLIALGALGGASGKWGESRPLAHRAE